MRSAVRSKRRGVFYVSGLFFRDLREDQGTNLFNRMIVLHAVNRFDIDATEYYVIHPDFEEIKEGERIPRYKPLFWKGSPFPQWVRVPGGVYD